VSGAGAMIEVGKCYLAYDGQENIVFVVSEVRGLWVRAEAWEASFLLKDPRYFYKGVKWLNLNFFRSVENYIEVPQNK
jgi:hypothetical protein